jgi:hypothetical protein
MFDELNPDELRELLRQLQTRQAETERLIRQVTERIAGSTAPSSIEAPTTIGVPSAQLLSRLGGPL